MIFCEGIITVFNILSLNDDFKKLTFFLLKCICRRFRHKFVDLRKRKKILVLLWTRLVHFYSLSLMAPAGVSRVVLLNIRLPGLARDPALERGVRSSSEESLTYHSVLRDQPLDELDALLWCLVLENCSFIWYAKPCHDVTTRFSMRRCWPKTKLVDILQMLWMRRNSRRLRI